MVTKPQAVVEVSLCCHYTCPEEPVVFGQLRKRRTDEGTRPINAFRGLLTALCRLTGVAEIRLRSGGPLLRFLAWPRNLLHKIGSTQGKCLLHTFAPINANAEAPGCSPTSATHRPWLRSSEREEPEKLRSVTRSSSERMLGRYPMTR